MPTTNLISSLTGHADSKYVDTRDSSHLQSSQEPSEVKFIEASNVQTAKSGQWLNNRIDLFSSSKEPDDLTTQMSVKNLPKFYLNQPDRFEKNIKSNDESRISTHSHSENKKLVASEVNNLKESSAALISSNKIERLSNDEFMNSQKTGAIATTNTQIKDNDELSSSITSRKNKDTNINIKLNSVNDNPLTKSHFDTNIKSLYKTNIGSTAILSCVLSSTNTLSRVSWLRGDEILSSGNITVSGDAR